jgi:hypothetical protein
VAHWGERAGEAAALLAGEAADGLGRRDAGAAQDARGLDLADAARGDDGVADVHRVGEAVGRAGDELVGVVGPDDERDERDGAALLELGLEAFAAGPDGVGALEGGEALGAGTVGCLHFAHALS